MGWDMPEAQQDNFHRTATRRRKGVWTAGCSCGWKAESDFAFTAWSDTRRHLTAVGALQPPPPWPEVRPERRN